MLLKPVFVPECAPRAVRRTGACPPNFKAAMEAEHCTLDGSGQEFTTLNYTEITSSPRREWRIAMQEETCPKEEMRFNRRIPVISELCALPLAKEAKLIEAEVIAVVLYTGPMVRRPFRLRTRTPLLARLGETITCVLVRRHCLVLR